MKSKNNGLEITEGQITSAIKSEFSFVRDVVLGFHKLLEVYNGSKVSEDQ